MSFNSHRRKLLDESEPIEHRASHARSCALHVANALGLTRESVIELVAKESGVDLHRPGSVAELMSAFATLEALRANAAERNHKFQRTPDGAAE
jgi:hypothetical protein